MWLIVFSVEPQNCGRPHVLDIYDHGKMNADGIRVVRNHTVDDSCYAISENLRYNCFVGYNRLRSGSRMLFSHQEMVEASEKYDH